MSSFNGIGTKLYGKRLIKSDGSYVATKWFIIFLLPFFPLGSYRIWRDKTSILPLGIGVKTKMKIEKVKFNYGQIFLTFISIWGSLFLLLYLIFTGY
jgi:hypothetical protein